MGKDCGSVDTGGNAGAGAYGERRYQLYEKDVDNRRDLEVAGGHIYMGNHASYGYGQVSCKYKPLRIFQ